MTRERPQSVDVGNVEDQARAHCEFGCRGLCKKERRAKIGSDQVVELIGSNCPDRRRIEGGGIIDEDIEATEVAGDRGNQSFARGGIGKVRLKSVRGTAAHGVQASDERIGLGLRAAVVDSEPGAVGMEGSGDRRTDAPGGSRDEDDLVCERHGVGRHGHRCALEYGWRTYHDPGSRRC